MKKLTILLLFITHFTAAQTASVTEIINKIDFKTDTIKSVYDWVTANIRYDVAKLNRMKKGQKPSNKSGFKTKEAYQRDQLEKVISRKRGVCQDYSLLFDAIVKQLGYESHIIEGYTKNDKGKIQPSIGHTWNAVKVMGVWKLYEPTWGAGYVKDNSRFVKKYNQIWYDVDPSFMIKRHMPFDPIWQLSNQPITYQDFADNKSVSSRSDKYDHQSRITAHMQKGKKEQMQDRLDRANAMGEGINLLEKWKRRQAKNIDLFEVRRQPDFFKIANEKSKNSSILFNEYIAAKNKKFRSKKWTTEYAKQTLLTVQEQTNLVIETYKDIEVKDPKIKRSVKSILLQSERLLRRVKNELKFLDNMKIR